MRSALLPAVVVGVLIAAGAARSWVGVSQPVHAVPELTAPAPLHSATSERHPTPDAVTHLPERGRCTRGILAGSHRSACPYAQAAVWRDARSVQRSGARCPRKVGMECARFAVPVVAARARVHIRVLALGAILMIVTRLLFFSPFGSAIKRALLLLVSATGAVHEVAWWGSCPGRWSTADGRFFAPLVLQAATVLSIIVASWLVLGSSRRCSVTKK
jgi:hypothetical protein